MTRRVLQYGATAGLAAMLWIVPSVGTRGQGTLGDRFVHADREVMMPAAAGDADKATRAALARADALVSRAVAGL